MVRHLFRPIDIAPLVFFRLFGCGLILIELAGGALSQVRYAYLATEMHFSYPFFEWVPRWPAAGIVVHWAVTVVAAACVVVGYRYRTAAVVWFFGATWLFLMEKGVFINHVYLYCLVAGLMIFLPAGRACSVDVVRRGEQPTGSAPAWTLYLLRFQMGVVYFYAAVAKCHADWLAGRPLALWLSDQARHPLGDLLTSDWLPPLMAQGGLLFDLLVVPGLLFARTRPLALTAAVFFHISNVTVFGIGTFPWFSLVMTLLFLEPATFRRIRPLARRLPPFDPGDGEGEAVAIDARRRATLWALGAYTAFHVLMPLRPFLYPGDSNWTKAASHFSWHMMLRSKIGVARFEVRDPTTGRTWRELPLDYITHWQYRKMVGDPDMILQFAHFLADDYATRGVPDVEVRAEVRVSLNGRPRTLQVDPDVDLAAERRSVWPYEWIPPLE